MGYLDAWGVSSDDIEDLLASNPAVRGAMFGYVAERKLAAEIASKYPDTLVDLGKPVDHDRKRKCDRVYRTGLSDVRVECKSLKTSTVKWDADGAPVSAKVQCDASDCREVVFEDGSSLRTTCLKVGEFDIVAVNMFAMFGTWRFAYAANKDLPRSTHGQYSAEQQQQLIATSIDITAELADPFTWDLEALIARLEAEGELGQTEPQA